MSYTDEELPPTGSLLRAPVLAYAIPAPGPGKAASRTVKVDYSGLPCHFREADVLDDPFVAERLAN
jgi:hypothetical protein